MKGKKDVCKAINYSIMTSINHSPQKIIGKGRKEALFWETVLHF
jgi:hypothetical protein